ncbi:7657_t:CDS:2 [Funneliformis mosseae]|uniref:7657_t:CDS:1 n=1 Tax=Funneliformis mosseae TaxID=27381 RepID=A0A9N8YYJ5_FUNMO|nr:7657_t:CDS:2 [Funneliformis mosseae]
MNDTFVVIQNIDPCELNLTKRSDEEILGLLIASDELLLEELFKHIQDYLIEKQTSWVQENFVNRVEWNQENFKALKKTLNQLIPLIRFVEISRADFLNKVHPYEAIIPRHMYKEIAEFHHKGNLPKMITLAPRVASTIIKPKLASVICNWIDKKDSNVLSFNNGYKFNLIYTKSRDGLDCMTFNNKCNLKGPFVVLIKVQSNRIYGGYNPIGYASRGHWSGEGKWLTSSNSFIFSFENDQDMQNMRIGRVINTMYSVYENYNRIFFNFGNHLFINRQMLHLNNNKIYNNVINIDNYKNVCLPIEEIEVFSVVKKCP